MSGAQAASADALRAEPAYPSLKGHVIEATGLAYYLDKDAELAEMIGKRLAALSLSDCAAYLAHLRDAQAGEAELDELAAELTIGETHFFRHAEQFDALRNTVLPDLLRKNAARRQLRVWSAGCSTGAEAYSLGILLRREFAGALSGWDVSIVGTDINRRFLAQARAGLFGEWALRGAGEGLRSLCFSREPGGWRVRDEYREGIAFQYHNLAKHPYPSLLHNLDAFDLILCRNVMIYFSREVIAACVRRFRDSLVDGGWLVVGHAEMNPDAFRPLRAVSVPGTILFERAAGTPAPKRPAAVEPLPELPVPQATWAPPKPPPVEEPAEPGDPRTARIRELADRARWDEAAELCRSLIEKDKLDPIGHLYHGLVLEQMGRPREARAALDRAIYLDRSSLLAHYHKGLLLQKAGEASGAARSLRNALDLLRALPPGTRLAEADGITAEDLAELARMQLDILKGA